jgi:hypothetical protein
MVSIDFLDDVGDSRGLNVVAHSYFGLRAKLDKVLEDDVYLVRNG